MTPEQNPADDEARDPHGECRQLLDFCQIVLPPSPGQRGTYDAATGKMYRDLLAKERADAKAVFDSNRKCNDDMEQALNDANRKANAAQVLNSNQRQMLDAVRQLCRNAPWDATIFARQVLEVIR